MTKVDIEKLADVVLDKLRSSGGTATLLSLSKKSKCDLSDIVSALLLLESYGYKFKKQSDSVSLASTPDRLIDSEIKYKLKTKVIGQKISAYQSVQSTNDIAARLALSGESEGTIVVAEQQTKGRGRRGRQWHSPMNRGIYLSIILKPKFKPESAPGLSIMTALALVETLEKIIPGKAKIKWPNDILIGGKKAAGILTELSADNNKIEYVIVGVGINVNHTDNDFPDELKGISTSLRKAKRAKLNRIELLKAFLYNFEIEYEKYKKSRLKPALKRIRKYSSLLNQPLELKQGRKIIRGVAVDIDERGALLVQTENDLITLTSGEVTVLKKRESRLNKKTESS